MFDPFQIYNFWHFLFLGIFLTAAITLAIVFRKTKKEKLITYIVLGILIACEIVAMLATIEQEMIQINGSEEPATAFFYVTPWGLPFHLCSIQTIVIIAFILIKNQKIKMALITFFIPTSIAGAALALLIPTYPSQYGWFSVPGIEFLFFHGALIFYGLFMYIRKYREIKLIYIFHAYCIMFGLSFISIYINSAVRKGANYFFTSSPPIEGLPILNLDNGWHMYLLTLLLLVVVLFAVMFSPVIIREIRFIIRKRKTGSSNDDINQ